jgi:predicted nucleotide-binding protein
MKRSTDYHNIHFHAEVIRSASDSLFGADVPKKEVFQFLSVTTGGSEWLHDTEEEFLADYQASNQFAYFTKTYKDRSLHVRRFDRHTQVEVGASDRQTIQATFNIFEAHLEQSRLPEEPEPEEPKPTIFIGHGRSPLWRDLLDHLHHQHGYPVEAYETGARAGHSIRDVLEHMLRDSSFAVLVMTGEDEAVDGSLRARQNVIHETGLFQGHLGYSRAIVLLEDGTDEFSNIHGVQQIRFSKAKIRETFGDVLATLRREFNDSTR